MIYSLTRRIGVIAINLFFNRISVVNKNNFPQHDPVIFVANHPNYFMDPLIIGSLSTRRLHFFAKSTLFDTKLKNLFLKGLNIIPIYRKMDDEKNMGKNIRSFEKGYKVLEDKNAILLFPEGFSNGKRVLGKIKTGAARIALEAEKRNDFKLNVCIVPIGISYSNIVQFRSNVIVKYGKAIRLKEFKEDFFKNKTNAVTAISFKIGKSLNELTNYFQNEELETLVEQIKSIYIAKLKSQLEMSRKIDGFTLYKILIQATEWFNHNNPIVLDELRYQLNIYFKSLNKLGVRDEFLNPYRNKSGALRHFTSIIILTLGFPVYLYGMFLNYAPYKLSRFLITDKTATAEIASRKLLYGSISYLIYYGIIVSLFCFNIHSTFFRLIFLISLIPSGNFALYYSKILFKNMRYINFLILIYKDNYNIQNLAKQRGMLVARLDELKKIYEKSNNS